MSGSYKPRYVPGEIVVFFHRDCSRDFAAHFGEPLGYRLKEDEYPYAKAFVYRTERRGEQAACDAFMRRRPFVAEAARRDPNVEKVLRNSP